MAAMTVSQLESALFAAFPRSDAEAWDLPGLSVGDPAAQVGRVAFNLDQSVEAVLQAAANGCNVLVTHHPPFIKDGPSSFGPAAADFLPGPGRMVYEAARLGVSVIAMHTNADRSTAVRRRFSQIIGLPCIGSFEHFQDPSRKPDAAGFGAVFAAGDGSCTDLGGLAALMLGCFGGAPRVWGDAGRSIRRFAFLNGSWSDPGLQLTCHDAGIDCIVVGETRYHMCADVQPALSVIELGHDRSELPIVDVLADAALAAGIDAADICKLDCSSRNWWSPRLEM